MDVCINVLGKVSTEAKDKLFKGAMAAGIRVYFPSEYGIDHRLNDFPSFEHPMWATKHDHIKHVTGLSHGKVKVISLYVGCFLEDSIGPWFGFDTESSIYTSIGPASTLIAFTSKTDVAHALVSLCSLAMSSPDKVSDYIRIAGDTVSFADVHAAASHESGNDIQIKEIGIDEFGTELKEAASRGSLKDPASYIRLLMGEGKLDWSKDNQNDLVNPTEKTWRWRLHSRG